MYKLDEILKSINQEYSIQNESVAKPIKYVKPLDEADEHSLIWIKSSKDDAVNIIKQTKAKTIICSKKVDIGSIHSDDKCFILVDNPRLAFHNVLKSLFSEKLDYSIHPTAIIHPKAKISENVSIGANSVIGDCTVEAKTVIEDNVKVFDGVKIGKNVKIEPGVVLGAEGGGYIKNSKGEYERIVHLGGVMIQNDVEIGANTTIDRATLGNTVIGSGTKIGNLVQIAHNVKIGERCLVISLSTIAGSSKIGDDVYLGPSVTISNGLNIGNLAYIALGSVVTVDVPDGGKVLGKNLTTNQKKNIKEAKISKNKSDIESRVKKIFKSTFPLEQNFSADSSPQNTQGWDSLGNLNFIVAIEEEFSTELPFEFQSGNVRVKDILNYLSNNEN